MQLHLEYNSDKNILFGSYSGMFTLQAFEAQLAEIVSTATFPANVPTIWDLTEMDFSQMDWDFINKLLEIRAKFPTRGNALNAIVAQTDLTFGISRMYASKGDSLPQTMQVFRSVEDAEAWIEDNSS